MSKLYLVYDDIMLCDENLSLGIPEIKGVYKCQKAATAYRNYIESLVPEKDQWTHSFIVTEVEVESDYE